MNNLLSLLALFTGVLIFPSCASTNSPALSAPGITLTQLLERMPPRDTIEARWVCSSVIGMGPDAILQICSRLGRPGTDQDTQAEFALQGLASYVTGAGRENERMIFVGALGKALDVVRSPEQSAFILGRIQLAGKGESIGLLARFLKDERLSEPAAQALVAIREGAELPLLSALPASRGNTRITIIKSLGDLRSRSAVDPLLGESASDDSRIRMAALYALANIGDRRAEDVLAKAAAAPAHDEVTSYYLLFARREAESGNSSGALRIGEQLFASRSVHVQIRAAVLDLIVRSKGESAIDDLTDAMADSSSTIRSAALRLASRIPGRSATDRWVACLESAGSRSEIISMLGDRGDTSAYPAVVSALSDADARVRACAVDAALRLRKEESLPVLLSVLERSRDARDIAAVKGALERLPSNRVIPPVIASLSRVTAPACVMLLEYVGKSAGAPAEPVFSFAKSADAPVHLAALKTLGAVGSENDAGRLIALLLAEESQAGRAVARNSLVALCTRIPDPEKRTESLLAAYRSAAPPQREILLHVISRLGGRRALALASGEARSKDPGMRDAAVRALADWPAMDAFDTLLVIAGSKEKLNLRVLALRGAVRLVENAPIPAASAVLYHERTLALAERPDEKRLVLGAVANLRSGEALREVIPYISDDSLGLDAAMAAGKIAADKNNGLGSAGVARAFIESMVPGRFRSRVVHNFDAAGGTNEPPEGFTALFNGRNLDGWKGLVENPVARANMTPDQLSLAQAHADSVMRAHWSVSDGILLFDGKGENICTARDYTDFEMIVDWKIEKNGDSGIYLRGSPQVQIWDPSQWPEGSGGLYNNQKNPAKPLQRADRPVGEWNSFRIGMTGERVTVWLNSVMVVDSVVLENYWNRSIPIFPAGQIELQSHNSPLHFRNIFIREIPSRKPLFDGSLFNGVDLTGWETVGGKEGSWGVEQGVLYTIGEGGGWLSTVREYGNFELNCDFRMAEGGNSGVFLRSPREGDPAYTGMEIQVLDDYAAEYASLQAWQYCGSIYGVQAPSLRASRKAHQWQHYTIVTRGPHVSVTLNGQLIVDADLISHMDKESTHPGLKRRSGFIGLQCHTARVEFRNITLKEIEWNEENDTH
ncbi:MAG TPA: family 16 glycoside hydrolase [Bacteroidota bacterium]